MDDEMQTQKDGWDKAEVGARIFGAVIVPLIVALVASIWSNHSSARQSAAQMSALAIGILQAEPKPSANDRALRDWAISVLQNPIAPPALSDDAADELRRTGLPSLTGAEMKHLLDKFSDMAMQRDGAVRDP